MYTPLPSKHSRLRIWSERCVLVLLAAVVFRTWYIQGLVFPCQVVGGSMADTLLGLHREVVCGDCGHRFVCGSDVRRVSPRAVCPNCGHADNDLEGRADLPGDRLLIHKSLLQLRPPRRWEVVTFRHPLHAAAVHLKRVVGLPGESVRIRDGDVYIDGEIRRKTLAQQRAVAVLVYDADHPPLLDPAVPPRWQSKETAGQWGSASGRFAYHVLNSDKEAIDWLEYCHWRRAPGGKGGVREGPVTDVCGYNQTRPRRAEDLHPVADLMLSLRLLDAIGEGLLLIRITDGREEFLVRLNPQEKRYRVLRNDRPIPGAIGKLPSWTTGLLIEVSLCDRQLLLAFDGREAFPPWPYYPSERPLKPTSRPVAIGSQGLPVVLEELRVYRDVYYTDPIGLQGRWALEEPVKLESDQYFVLGDNSPISNDGRTWSEGPAISAKLLLGKPLLVHFHTRRIQLGGRFFQVPDLAKIRYIR